MPVTMNLSKWVTQDLDLKAATRRRNPDRYTAIKRSHIDSAAIALKSAFWIALA